MMRNFSAITVLLIGIMMACRAPQHINSDESRPNVIIILTDDQGYGDLGCFGADDIATPHLDKLAHDGLILTDFYAAQAVCSASRAGILTGCYPNRIGVHGAYMPDSPRGLHPSETTIAEMLKSQDYKTGIFGKWHLGDHPDFMPLNQGFDEYFGIPYSNDMWPLHPQQGPIFNFDPLPLYHNDTVIDTLTDQSLLTTHITERSIKFIARNKDTPFFAYVAHPQPHVPLYVSDKFKGKSQRGIYGDVIMEIDWSVGQIVAALDEHQLLENTLIIFTSDNGPWLNYGSHSGSAYPLREGKGTAWEGGQREPTIVHYPKQIDGGRTLHTPMMNIDILPTIAEITAADLPDKIIDGKSLWNIWNGQTSESPHEAYYYYYKQNELHGVRYKDWKLYYPHSYRTLNGRIGNTDGTPVNYDQDTLRSIELYLLSQDVGETNDVAAEYPEIVDTISALAVKMRLELGDNLLGINGRNVRESGLIE